MSAILTVDDLRVAYGRVEALFGVSIRVEPGQIVTVVGPNGAGKSTLLNAIAAVIPAASGRIAFLDRPLHGQETEELAAAGMALVPERRDLFGTMTVRDNLLLGGYLPRAGGRRGVEDGLRAVFARFPRLEERQAQAAGTLSGGERQMLAIGRALMSRPRLLLLDEPSLGLAPRIVRDVFDTIADLRRDGVAILVVEQNAHMALKVADHAYVMEMGEIVKEGRGSDMMNDQGVKDTYLGIGHGSYAE